MTDMLRNAELSVGNGRNLFAMSRGSFSYKQKITKKFLGTSLVVRTDACAEEIVQKTVEDGWEPHYAVIYGDVADELCILAHMLGMKPVRF